MTPEQTAKQIVSELQQDYPDSMQLASAMIPIWLERRIAEAIQAESNAQLMRNRAHDRQADVAAFVRKFGQHQEPRPGFPPQEVLDMRVRLIAEEFCEFLQACGYDYSVHVERWFDLDEGALDLVFSGYTDRDEPPPVPDFAKAADGLVDLEYVTLGTHVAMGIDSNPLWAAVHAANMSKVGGATREDGKILKPEGFKPPDIAAELRKQGWRDGSEA